MKTQPSIWLCRDGGSSTKPKFGKSRAETNENAVFNLAVSGRRIFGEAKVSESRALRQMQTCPRTKSNSDIPLKKPQKTKKPPRQQPATVTQRQSRQKSSPAVDRLSDRTKYLPTVPYRKIFQMFGPFRLRIVYNFITLQFGND